ncbi:MAG: hypothetical protein ACLQD9_01640 [Thermoplasmata archaeon]
MSVGATSGTLVMYVASQAGLPGGLIGEIPFAFGARLASLFVPFAGLAQAKEVNAAQAADEGDPDELPPSARQCILLVLDYAKRYGWSVHLVDVTRQRVSESEILGSLGAEAHLPLLVRPDRARLEGEEQFTPSAVRKFLRRRR